MSGPRWAYWIKDRIPADVAGNPPARLRAAWPKNPAEPEGCWMVHKHPSGEGTLCVFPRLDGAACRLDQFGTPRETEDGMVFYPTLNEPSLEFLIKPETQRGPGEWVELYQGLSLWIGIAFASPRRLALATSGIRLKDPVSEFGRLGHELFDLYFSAEGLDGADPRLSRLIFLAIRESYYVTEESAEDLPWLTDRDIGPIARVALGASPKLLAAGRESSPSAAQTTPTSP